MKTKTQARSRVAPMDILTLIGVLVLGTGLGWSAAPHARAAAGRLPDAHGWIWTEIDPWTLGDSGLQGVSVLAYDATGAVAAQTVSGPGGAYTLSGVSDGRDYRVEFHNLAGYLAGPYGADNGSTVVFATAPAETVDLGLWSPGDYCPADPLLATSRFVTSTQNLPGRRLAKLPLPEPGPVAGACGHRGLQPGGYRLGPGLPPFLGWSLRRRLPEAAFRLCARQRPRADLSGDRGSGAATVTSFLELQAGTNPQSTSASLVTDAASYDLVGKLGLPGDIDLSEDESTLWAVNLFDRQLYQIPLAGTAAEPQPPLATQVRRWPANKTPGTHLGNLPGMPCPTDDVRPPRVGRTHRGLVYVGMVCSAQSSKKAADLRGLVYALFPLTGSEDCSRSQPGLQPWSGLPQGQHPDFRRLAALGAPLQPGRHQDRHFLNIIEQVYPQPWLTDIEFDGDQIIIGLRDRFGDQLGFRQVPLGSRSGLGRGRG